MTSRSSRLRARLTPIVALFALGACDGCSSVETPAPATPASEPAPEAAQAEVVRFEGADGFLLEGSLWAGPSGAPAVVLMHQLGAERAEWSPVIIALVDAGFSVLAFDQRGHGASTRGAGGEEVRWRDFGPEDWAAYPADARAAVAWLRSRPSPPRSLVLGGSSIGSSAALIAGAELEGVRGVFALSPGRAYRGLDVVTPLAGFGERALLAVAAEGEAPSVDTLAAIEGAVPGAE
ncbi:MAG: alpha/beta fold hydrolase, partial [Myxococcota bacterium]